MDAETREALDYLEEVLAEYGRYVNQIGRLGLAAPNLFYYRDEVQEFLEMLSSVEGLDLTPVWNRVRELDHLVREKKREVVREVGRENFKQYQIINDPPTTHWWWFLDRLVPPPPPPPRPWEFWKK